MDGVALVIKVSNPVGVIVDAVLILRGHISVPLVGRLLSMSVLQVRFKIVGAGEGGSLAALDPALEETVFVLLVDGLFVSLLVLLTLEALLLACLLVDAAWIATGELVLSDDHLTVNAGLAGGWLRLERWAKIVLLLITSSSRHSIEAAMSPDLGSEQGPFGFLILDVFRLVLRWNDRRRHQRQGAAP